MGCICINEKPENEIDDYKMQEIRKAKRLLIILLFKF